MVICGDYGSYSLCNDIALLLEHTKMKKLLILLIILSAVSLNLDAQCAMCRAVLESEQGQGTAEGINNGIVYLMAIPYILAGSFGYYIYYRFYKK